MNSTADLVSSCKPLVSVVMAVHNGEDFLGGAVESILTQTYSNIELLIIDDGSTDNCPQIIRRYAGLDTRIRAVQNDVNLGLASSLNKGFSLARGKYIARMDSDDISLPRRLEVQVAFLERCTEVSMCGTWAKYFGFQSLSKQRPTNHEDIRASLLFYTPIFHPSVMFRKSDIGKLDYLYEDNRQRVEDLELWSRLTAQLKVANLPEYLLKYRVYDPQNVEKRKAVVAHGNVIRKKLLQAVVTDLSEDQFSLHMKIASCTRNDSVDFMYQAADWLEELLHANQINPRFAPDALSRVVSERWWRVCKSSTELGPVTHKIYQSKSALMQYDPGLLMNLAWLGKRLIFYRGGTESIHDNDLKFVTQFPK